MNIYRGDIYYIKSSNYLSVEYQSGTDARPAIIVSNDKMNQSSDECTVVYLSGNDNRPDIPTHVPVICKTPSVAKCETLCRIKQNRIGEFVRACTDAEMRAIDKALLIQLGIDNVVNNVNDSERIKELEKRVAAEMARADKERAEKHELQKRIGELIEKMESEAKAADETKHVVNLQNDVMLARAQAERDVYKGLLERWFAERV